MFPRRCRTGESTTQARDSTFQPIGLQEEDWDQVRAKAQKLGATKMVIKDLRREFVEQLCFRAIQCNAQYEGRYLLGTSLARPVIARAQMQVALEEGCKYTAISAC